MASQCLSRSCISYCDVLIQGLAGQLKAREETTSSAERRLEAESRALQQQRQDAELAGMKAQLAVQQQQQHSPMMSPLLQANPQLGGRSASRLQVCTTIGHSVQDLPVPLHDSVHTLCCTSSAPAPERKQREMTRWRL